jgi:hypothetical protein
MRAGQSVHMRQRAELVAGELRTGNVQNEAGKAQLVETRRTVVRGWLGAAEVLRADGRDGLALEVERYVRGMSPPQTEREWIAQALQERAREPYRQAPLAMTR